MKCAMEPAVFNDPFTARVVGAVTIIMTLLIDISCLMFTRPEISQRPSFPLVVLVPSLPLFAFGIYLFRRASRMKAEE